MAGFVYSGAQAGTVLSLPISGLLCSSYGWPTVCYVFGLLGILWWLAWCWLVADSPDSNPRIDESERRYIVASLAASKAGQPSSAVPWLAILSSPAVWALTTAHIAQNYGFYTLLTELPAYMANVLHFNIRDNSLVSALPYLAMLAVSLTVTRLAVVGLAAGYDRTTVR